MWALLPDTAQAIISEVHSFDGSRLTIDLTATGEASALFDPGSLHGLLTNVSPGVAAERLRDELALSSEPHISVHPGWIPGLRMPRRSDRISITLVSEEELAAARAGEPFGEELEEDEEADADEGTGDGGEDSG